MLDDGVVIYSGAAAELAQDEERVRALAGASAEEWTLALAARSCSIADPLRTRVIQQTTSICKTSDPAFRLMRFARTIGGKQAIWRLLAMKMRASNLVIGTTTLAILAIGVFGLLGVRKIRAISQETRMRIVFEGGSASGLRRGGSVNFDGVQIGEVISLRLDNPRKVVAEVRVDKNAPIRKDTVVGLEFQGLTGIAAISLIGGDSADPPVPPTRMAFQP